MTNEQYEEAVTFWERKDAETKKLPEEELKAWIDQFLGSHNVLALSTGSGQTIRCTPLEYTWHDGALWIFTEGGLKFQSLKANKNVAAAVFDTNASFGSLKSVQIEGTADVVELFSDEYTKAAEFRKIPIATLKKLAEPMWLLKIIPSEMTCLNSDFKKNGYGSRQFWSADNNR